MKRSLVSNLLFLMVICLVSPVIADSSNAQVIKIAGEVGNPGLYPYVNGDKVSALIRRAGLTLNSGLSGVQVIRPTKGPDKVMKVDVSWLLTSSRISSSKPVQLEDIELKPGDSIIVPARSAANISLQLRDVPLVTALETIMEKSQMNYFIDPALKDMNLKVTAVLKNVSLETAVKTVIGASSITYHIDGNNVVKFTPGRPGGFSGYTGRVSSGFGTRPKSNNAGNSNSAGAVPAVNSNPDNKDNVLQIIVLKHLKAGDAAPIIAGIKGISAVQSSGDSQLVVSGSQDAVRQAVDVISKIDLPDAYPRVIRVLMEIDFKNEDAVHTIKTEAVGRDGESMPMQLSADFPVGNDESIGSISLNATVTPNYVDPSQITLDGEGIVMCSERELSASGRQLGELKNPFKFTVSVPDASAQAQDKAAGSRGKVISSGDISVDNVKAGFTIYIKANAEGRAAKSVSPGYGPPGASYGGFSGGMPPAGGYGGGMKPGGGGFGGRVATPKK